MHKNLLFLLLLSIPSFAQVLSPSDFLGYPISSRFTPHHKVIDYAKHVAGKFPQNIQIESYGTTSEMRPLMILKISSSTTIANLADKQAEHLASMSKDVPNAPMVVWLSYNVHGNEASGCEAFMEFLYHVVSNPTTYFRDDLILLLDPCINPDGRDRYVNWYNQMLGRNPNADQNAREHREPWPGGRTNHYGYDLNRDWLWQTQKETVQRMKVYHAWMPHVHADFHEMGPESSYYFPPAAKPFHEVITPWQREFQQVLGAFIRLPFDANGWGYFTKEDYDLLYPSYGDTYPIYNGAVGMTLEQGGSGRAGLLYIKQNGDSLTLLDRYSHHVATSKSIVAASLDKADRLKREYSQFFSAAVEKGAGKYKSFVLKNTDSPKLKELLSFLDKIGLEHGILKNDLKSKAFYYRDKTEKEVSLNQGDVVISTYQPRGTLVRVLFEPDTFVEDSSTYDITAWALPYVYNLEAWALEKNVEQTSADISESILQLDANAYAYLLHWEHVKDAHFLSKVLKQGIVPDVHEATFEINGKKFNPGTLIFKPSSAQKEAFLTLAKNLNVNLTAVQSGMVSSGADLGSGNVRSLKVPKVALVSGEGSSVGSVADVWHFFDETLDYPVSLLHTSYLDRVDLWNYTTIIFADGSYDYKDKDAIMRWVGDGGNLVLLEGASSLSSSSFKEKKNDSKTERGKYAGRSHGNDVTGAILRVSLDNTHPLAYGYGESCNLLFNEVPPYDKMEKGWQVGTLKENTILAGLVGSKAKENLPGALVVGSERKGKGHITYFAVNPLFRGFWADGKLLMANAVFMQD